jgi:hypothetical protein
MKFLGVPSSGSTAGTTFSHNRAGQYTRNRRTPVVGTRTPRQAVIKGNMTLASQAWQVLTSAQQAAWTSYASGHPIVDALGQSIKLTGHQYFIKCQAALFNTGSGAITDPPVSGTVTAPIIVSFQVDTGPHVILTTTGGNALDYVNIAVSKTTSLGVNFQKTFSQVDSRPASTAILDETDATIAFAGSIVVGRKVWMRITPVNQYGLTGTPIILQSAVTAPPAIALPVMTSAAATDITATWAGSPTPANVWYQVGSGPTGPWSATMHHDGVTSPDTLTGQTSGFYGRGRLQDPGTGFFGAWSASHIIT